MEQRATKRGVVLLTGSTDGIGRATAGRFAEAGWTVVITGRNEARCVATVDEIRRAYPAAEVEHIVADLSSMKDVCALSETFRGRHDRLDHLVLNANSITQEHTRTRDGFEANFAIGYLSRALLAWKLEDALRRGDKGGITSVVGLNLQRIDFDDPGTQVGYSSMKALGRWQWAIQVFGREWCRRAPEIAMNTYMPGLVRTKILATEPQPMRLIVQVMNRIMGVPVDRAGVELYGAIEEMRRGDCRDVYFARTKNKGRRSLKEEPRDGALLWERTREWLARWVD